MDLTRAEEMAISAFAEKPKKDDLSVFERPSASNAEITEILKEVKKEQKKEDLKTLATAISKIEARAEAIITDAVGCIRLIRKEESTILKNLRLMRMAGEIAATTGNYSLLLTANRYSGNFKTMVMLPAEKIEEEHAALVKSGKIKPAVKAAKQ